MEPMDDAYILMDVLSRAAAALAAPQADAGVIDRILESAPQEAGLACHLRMAPEGLVAAWDGQPSREQESFVDALGHCLALALAAGIAGDEVLLDSGTFAVELERALATARWRSQPIAIAVFTVHGLELGPRPVDQRDLILHVGALARSAVRHDDRVGHLGADQFALLFPRAGEFEARAAFKRVRTSLAGSELISGGIVCGAAGFAELDEHASGAELLADARERLSLARRRAYYPAPTDPTQPLAG
jgi:GGDEF domain-containing protein